MNNYEMFEEWCEEQKVNCTKNNKIFYLENKEFVKPDYLINGVVFVKIIDSIPKITRYRTSFQEFKKTYGPLLIIPAHVILDIKYNLNISDLEKEFNLKIS